MGCIVHGPVAPHRPQDSYEASGERDNCYALATAFSHCTCPEEQRVTLVPLAQDDPGCLHQQCPQVAVAPLVELAVCRCRDSPEGTVERPCARDEYEDLLETSSLRQAMGTGAYQAAPRRWFLRVRGYDERYVFWGFEDKDMVRRAQVCGLHLSWIHQRSSMLHQWHPTTKNDRRLRKELNRWRFHLTGWKPLKNWAGW